VHQTKNYILATTFQISAMVGLLVFLLLGPHMQAQKISYEKQRYFGFGINLNNLQSGIARLNVDPSDYFRTEFQFGNQKSSRDQWYYDQFGVNTKTTLYSKSNDWLIGLYASIPYKTVKFFLGVCYQQTNEMHDAIYYNTNFNFFEGVYTSKFASRYYGPLLGAEYRFGNRFALGADVALLFGKSLYLPGTPDSKQTEGESKLTRTSLFIRFFPF
jgi:hypothetical protein